MRTFSLEKKAMIFLLIVQLFGFQWRFYCCNGLFSSRLDKTVGGMDAKVMKH